MKKVLLPFMFLTLFACQEEVEFIECKVWLIQHDNSKIEAESYMGSSQEEVSVICEEFADKYKSICSVWCECE